MKLAKAILAPLLMATGMATGIALASPAWAVDPANWEQVEADARGQTVYFNDADSMRVRLETLHDRIEATVLFAKHVFGRDTHVLENQFGGVRAQPAMLFELA